MKALFTTERHDSYITVNTIPYDSIEKLEFAQCQQPKETLGNFYSRQDVKPDIVINGGLFNMSTGMNVMSFVDEGKEQNYQNGFEGLGILGADLTHLLYGTDKGLAWKDFMTGYPMLVKDGVMNTAYGNATNLNYMATRQAIGYNDEGIIIVTVDKPGIKFDALAQLFLAHNAKYAINLDGGGSVRKLVNGEVANVPTEDRPVDNVFCVYLKDVTEPDVEPVDDDFIPGVYKVTAHVLNVRNTPSMSGAVIGTVAIGAELNITALSADKLWGEIAYDAQVGYVYLSWVDRICDYIPELPEEEESADNSSVDDSANNDETIDPLVKYLMQNVADYDQIPAANRKMVANLLQLKIMSTDDIDGEARFYPDRPMTRLEVAQALNNLALALGSAILGMLPDKM